MVGLRESAPSTAVVRGSSDEKHTEARERERQKERESRRSGPGAGPSAGVGESASSARLRHSPHCVPVE